LHSAFIGGAVVLVLLAWTLGVLGDELPRGPSRALGLYIHVAAGCWSSC
jgi:cytochrome b561